MQQTSANQSTLSRTKVGFKHSIATVQGKVISYSPSWTYDNAGWRLL